MDAPIELHGSSFDPKPQSTHSPTRAARGGLRPSASLSRAAVARLSVPPSPSTDQSLEALNLSFGADHALTAIDAPIPLATAAAAAPPAATSITRTVVPGLSNADDTDTAAVLVQSAVRSSSRPPVPHLTCYAKGGGGDESVMAVRTRAAAVAASSAW